MDFLIVEIRLRVTVLFENVSPQAELFRSSYGNRCRCRCSGNSIGIGIWRTGIGMKEPKSGVLYAIGVGAGPQIHTPGERLIRIFLGVWKTFTSPQSGGL